jgi:aromatic ring-opening dioxygenase catalytic subunit (LigB family)
MALPALYISHGSPRLIIEPSAARDFLAGLARTLPKPHTSAPAGRPLSAMPSLA